MITVRYPNGQAVTYNDATYLTYADDKWRLYTKKGDEGQLVAAIQLSAGATCEFREPCKVENAALTIEAAAQLLANNPRELRKLRGGVLAELKRALHDFNAKRWTWK